VNIKNKKIKVKWLQSKVFVKYSDISKWMRQEHVEKIRVLSNAKTINIIPDNEWGTVKYSTWFWVVA